MIFFFSILTYYCQIYWWTFILIAVSNLNPALPPIHPPIHPSTHLPSAILFCTKKECMPNSCIYFLLLCANSFLKPVFTGLVYLLLTLDTKAQNFQLQTLQSNANAQNFQFQALQFYFEFFPLFEIIKNLIFLNWHPLKFIFKVIRNLILKNWTIFGLFFIYFSIRTIFLFYYDFSPLFELTKIYFLFNSKFFTSNFQHKCSKFSI